MGKPAGSPGMRFLSNRANAAPTNKLAADDRFDPCPFARLEKLDSAVHVALVRQRDGRHLEFRSFFSHRFNRSG